MYFINSNRNIKTKTKNTMAKAKTKYWITNDGQPISTQNCVIQNAIQVTKKKFVEIKNELSALNLLIN